MAGEARAQVPKGGTWGARLSNFRYNFGPVYTLPFLILFAEGLDVGFAVGVEEVFAALLPGGF
jgi:hypothetical protein